MIFLDQGISHSSAKKEFVDCCSSTAVKLCVFRGQGDVMHFDAGLAWFFFS